MPTPRQELLLDAAFAAEPLARPAWNRWLHEVELENLDRPCRRLLPLAAARMAKFPGISVPARILGLRRKAWFQNQVLIHRALEPLQMLQSRGMDIVILKGLAFTELYYRDRSLRPMEDIDFMVPLDRVEEAVRLLGETGWKPKYPVECPMDAYFRFANHAWGFQKPPTGQIDLHWRWLRNGCTQERIHTRPVPLEINDMTLNTLMAEDHLLQICDHAVRYVGIRECRWVADILTLLACRGHDFEWARFLHQAGRTNLKLPARLALEYVAHRFNAPIPDTVLNELATHEPIQQETAWYRLAARGRMVDWPMLLNIRPGWQNDCPAMKNLATSSRVKRTLSFARARFRVSSCLQIPLVIVSKVTIRTMRALARLFKPHQPG